MPAPAALDLMRPIGLALAALALGGCQLQLSIGFDDFDDRQDAFSELLGEQLTTPVTAPAAMPVTGEARYEGFAALSTSDETLIGELRAVADFDAPGFADGSIVGTVSDVVSDRTGGMEGTLDLETGAIAGNAFVADLDGSLTDTGRSLTIDATVTGLFRGPAANGITGTVTGTLIEGAALETLTGTIVAD